MWFLIKSKITFRFPFKNYFTNRPTININVSKETRQRGRIQDSGGKENYDNEMETHIKDQVDVSPERTRSDENSC